MIEDPSQCYLVLGIVHSLWTPIPGEFDDYIAKPKENGYQSLHTAVIGPGGKALKVEIRIRWMHQIADTGLPRTGVIKSRAASATPSRRKNKLAASVAGMARRGDDGQRFVNASIPTFFATRSMSLLPKGQIIEMATGATPIDFAYHIHTEVGNRCRGAKVNGKMVAL